MFKTVNKKTSYYFYAWSFVLLAAFLWILSPATGSAAVKKVEEQKAVAALIDINTASEKELEGLKGVGPAIAKKIVANRPYKTADELSKAGLSAKAITAIKPLVTVGKVQTASAAASVEKAAAKTTAAAAATVTDVKKAAKETKQTAAKSASAATAKLAPGTKININTADQAALEKLPEIGAAKAQAIIKGRPYKSAEDVMKVSGIKEKTFAAIKDYITVK